MNCLPLSERVLLTGSSTSHCVGTTRSRPVLYKTWTYETMSKAINAVVQEGMTVRRAATVYAVPKSTLADRVSGRIIHGSSSGVSKFLTDEEEEELVAFILGSASIGYSKTIKEILALVQGTLEARGVHKVVSYGWWESFRRRHPNLTLRVSSSLSKSRLLASNRLVLDHYFDLLEETLEENGLKDKPYQVFNMDETGMPLDMKPLKTVHSVGEKNPYTLSSGNKSQITVVGCVNAGGQYLPPMVIWDRKNLKPELTEGELPQTIYGLSKKGWMDQELFERWFRQLFLRCAPAARPLALLLDGHSSHYSPSAIKMAAEEKVILFAFPPNTTHLSQPLDKGVFGPLKMHWRKACHRYMSEHPGHVVHSYVFSRLFHIAWVESMTTKNIVAGFRTTGIYPTNRHAIVLPGESDKPKVSLSEKTGVSFIPLLTPSKKRQSSVAGSVSFELGDKDSPNLLPFHSTLSKMLPVESSPPSPRSPSDGMEKYYAKVLTSSENLKLMKAKEDAKREKEMAKQAAKVEREKLKQEREDAKREKERVREMEKEKREKAKQEKERAKQAKKGKGYSDSNACPFDNISYLHMCRNDPYKEKDGRKW